ncbi:MAG: hypothetical protein IJU81_04415 [Bacteroidales bacterium]|nr:hypothetical protein [Bacteroidales bacterium]
MAKNTSSAYAKNGYDWKFSTVGGITRVNIETGEDIAHLDELDQKLWTVLSCPVKGLEFDERTLSIMDCDGDGKIRVNEILSAVRWLRDVLRNMNYLETGADYINFMDIRDDSDAGKEVIDAARLILNSLSANNDSISLGDVDKYMTIYEEHCKAELEAQPPATYNKPYGDDSDAAVKAVVAMRKKISDYFMRCKLVQFDSDATEALDVQVEKIASISGGNLSDNMAEIAEYPLARPSNDGLLPLGNGINPAWQADMNALKAIVFDKDFAGQESISEEQWNSVLAKIDAYTGAKTDADNAVADAIAAKVATHAAAILPVERLLRYCRDFMTLIHNYVVFKDFYLRDDSRLAVFQAGKLFIDQRQCDLCIKVADMGKQTDMAGLSGLYLLYCHCTSKVSGKEMDIAAALTDGDVDSLRVGKNAIFYDRNGLDWDATVTKIIDNPISIRQAFWSPYKKFWNWITEKINKSAADKEAASMDKLTSNADNSLTEMKTELDQKKEGTTEAKLKEKTVQMFDIAKFAGIFAAIGLALGFVMSAISSLGKGMMNLATTMSVKSAMPLFVGILIVILLLILAIILIISGPSMFIAWTKLRKRNLGPVLNANGWAINSQIRINTTFGATLTQLAKYPKIVLDDPFAEKKMPLWKKILIWAAVIIILGIIIMLCLRNSHPLYGF